MRVTPVEKIPLLRNPLRRTRAMLAVNYKEFSVLDSETGERTILPFKQAGELLDRLNTWA